GPLRNQQPRAAAGSPLRLRQRRRRDQLHVRLRPAVTGRLRSLSGSEGCSVKFARPAHRFAALLAAPIAFAVAGGGGRCAELPTPSSARAAPAQQFYARVLGDWVGTTVSRLDSDPPVTGYFHLLITRVGENAFQEEYIFYRIHPNTGLLERSGTQTDLTTI